MVVVPGVHHLGMEEPRLRRFARALASHGYLVLTPQVDDLADYNITKNSAVVIGDAVHELARRSGAPKVGLLGLSFAGGMALIAASDEAVEQQLSGVIAIGAHDDLNRVLNFYRDRRDAGSRRHGAQDEGARVRLAGVRPTPMPRPSFRRRMCAQARITLRTLLWEDLPQAHAEAAKLSPQGQARMAQLFAHDTKSLVPDTQRGLAAAQPEIEAASPHYYSGQGPRSGDAAARLGGQRGASHRDAVARTRPAPGRAARRHSSRPPSATSRSAAPA